MIKEFYCNRCMRHLTQDKKSKVYNCCTACGLIINKNQDEPKINKPASFVKIMAHTKKHKEKMDALAYE